MKKQLYSYIDSISKDLISMSDFIFDNPELGLQEYKASQLLCNYLQANNFIIERGVGEVETAFRAIYENGTGGPSIGLLVEYDALEKMGHACGHHLQGPSLVGSALAIKEVLKDKPYKLVVYGTPAEETTSGKITMLNNGCFQDIDVAFMMHGNPGTTVDVRSMAMIKYTVTFNGIASHAALRPELGRGALDALILSFQGLEFMREHTPDDTRIHYTVLDAGGPANTVSPKAVGSFYVRTYNTPSLKDIGRRFENVMKGAALMTDTTVEIKVEKELEAKIPVHTLNNLIMDNAKELDVDDLVPPREKTGSTDFGNVMYRVPGTCLRMGFVPQGSSSHSQVYLDAGKGETASRAVVLGAKITAGACFDLIMKDDLLDSVLEEFKRNKEDAINNR